MYIPLPRKCSIMCLLVADQVYQSVWYMSTSGSLQEQVFGETADDYKLMTISKKPVDVRFL